MIGISRLLKHLSFGEHLLRFMHLEFLQFCNILSASFLLTGWDFGAFAFYYWDVGSIDIRFISGNNVNFVQWIVY